jgi:hypothetical protein
MLATPSLAATAAINSWGSKVGISSPATLVSASKNATSALPSKHKRTAPHFKQTSVDEERKRVAHFHSATPSVPSNPATKAEELLGSRWKDHTAHLRSKAVANAKLRDVGGDAVPLPSYNQSASGGAAASEVTAGNVGTQGNETVPLIAKQAKHARKGYAAAKREADLAKIAASGKYVELHMGKQHKPQPPAAPVRSGKKISEWV